MKCSEQGKFRWELTGKIPRAFLAPLVLILSLLTPGCGGFRTAESNIYQIPWPDENGVYHLQNVAIGSFDQPQSLQGRHVQILVNPGMVDGQLQGERARGHYLRTRDGVMVPTDYTSVEAAAIHGHFERFMLMDRELNAVSNWPARIAIDVNVRADGRRSLNNAFYAEDFDALFVPPYTALDVPIAVNGGVLAHEHFHRIFHAMVFKHLGRGGRFPKRLAPLLTHSFWDEGPSDESVLATLQETKEEIKDAATDDQATDDQVLKFNAFYMSALNEGLADFWGWVYTGDPEFIKPSLPKLAKLRRLDVRLSERLAGKPQLLAWTTSTMSGKALTVEQLKANSYFVGTSYARLLRELTQALSPGKQITRTERMAMAAAVIKTLPSLAEKIAASLRAKELINPNTFWLTLYPYLESVDDAASGRLCRSLRRWAAPEWEQELQKLKCIEPRHSTPRTAARSPLTPEGPKPPKTPSSPHSPTTPSRKQEGKP